MTNVARVADIVVLPLLQLISGLFVISLLALGVLLVGKLVAVGLITVLLCAYLGFTFAVTPFLRFAARQRIRLEMEANEILSGSMRTIVDLQLTGSEPYFERRYAAAGRSVIGFAAKAEILPELPRALIEPFGITMIFAVGMLPLLGSQDPTGLARIVPFLATVAITSLKLTPPLQDCFRAATCLRAGLPDLQEILS